jgi:hypothetical protein
VSKRRRISRFSLAGRLAGASDRGLGEGPACAVELSDVYARGEAWWTLGFEATGPANVLRSELEAAAALVFAVAVPGGLEPGVDDSRSYAQWLCQGPQALGLSPEPEGDPLAEVRNGPSRIRES